MQANVSDKAGNLLFLVGMVKPTVKVSQAGSSWGLRCQTSSEHYDAVSVTRGDDLVDGAPMQKVIYKIKEILIISMRNYSVDELSVLRQLGAHFFSTGKVMLTTEEDLKVFNLLADLDVNVFI